MGLCSIIPHNPWIHILQHLGSKKWSRWRTERELGVLYIYIEVYSSLWKIIKKAYNVGCSPSVN